MRLSKDKKVLTIKLDKVDKKVLNKYPKLEVVASPTTGLDHIDLKECKKRGIKVISLKEETEFLKTIPATAEHTMGLILSLVRRIPWAFDSVLSGEWDRESFKGRDLKDKTLVVVGYGRIGKMITKYAEVFGMKVYHGDRKEKKALLKVLSKADIVTLHIPLEGNKNYFDKKCFQAMKKGSYFVNTSRGGIIDEQALLEALKGRIAGAALDVVQGEPEVNPELLEYALDNDNLLLTCHIGGCTVESMTATEKFIAEKVKKYVKTIRKK